MVEQWALQRGATVVAGGGVRFSVWAPSAERVAVRLRSSGGEREYPLESHRMGVFEGTVREARAGDDYRYVLAGPKGTPDKALPDPVSRFQPEGVHGPSRVVDPAAFRWTDDGWSGLEMPEYVIYELHVGTFSDAGTFDGAIEHLAGLRDLGVTAIEIMPVAQFPGARNWGYDGVLPYAVQDSYGGPEGLRRLVDAAHATGLAVVLDVVYNHFGPEGNYLGGYGPYFTDTYKTPWGPALNYDGRDSDEVRRYFIDNALYWITEFHMDALRLDAIHGIFDFGARHVLRDIADAVRAQGIALGRHAIVIGESDLNDPKVVRSAAEHGFGMDAQWADDLHHAIHSVLTGETNGYYADFGGVRPVAQSLGTPFYYAGTYSAHRRRRHGAPATGLPLDRFVVSVQNHDQVGNRATGDRLSTLVGFDRLKLAAALLLLSPYVPMLFMGEEYGETNPFLYFVSHGDQKLLDAVREGRKKEFASFGWGDAVPDPGAEESFVRSRLDRGKLQDSRHAAMRRLYHDLLRCRSDEPALRPGSADVEVRYTDGSDQVMLVLTPRGGVAGAPPGSQGAPDESARRQPDATARVATARDARARSASPRGTSPRGSSLGASAEHGRSLAVVFDFPSTAPRAAADFGDGTTATVLLSTYDARYRTSDTEDAAGAMLFSLESL